MNAAQMDYEFKVGYDAITNFSAPGYEFREISTFLTKAQERVMLHIINPSENPIYTGIEQTQKRRSDLSEYIRSAKCTPSSDQSGSMTNGVFYDLPTDYFYMLNEDAFGSDLNCKKLGQKRILIEGSTYDPSTNHFLIGETVSATDPTGAPGNVVGTYIIQSGGGRQFFILLVTGSYPSIGNIITGATSSAQGTIEKITNPITDLWVKPVTHDYVTINMDNPFKKPYNEMCWRLEFSRLTANTTSQRIEIITDGTYTIEEYIIRYYCKPKPILVPTPAPPAYPAYTIDSIASSVTGTDCELFELVHRQIVDEAVRLAVAALQETNSYQVKSVEASKSE